MRRLIFTTFACIIAFSSHAELQNVVVNGNYSVNDEDRFVRISNLSGDRGRISPNYLTLPAVGIQNVKIPLAPTPRQYPNLGRVFLSFHVGVPQWKEGNTERMELRVLVDEYPAFTRQFTEPGWHTCLVDMAPWAGQNVHLQFRSGWIDGASKEVIIALPRLAAWHGPLYEGHGGLGYRSTYHGYSPLGRAAPDWMNEDVESLGGSVKVDSSTWRTNGLLVARVDCLVPSAVLTRSGEQTVVTNLPSGYHWLPIRLSPGPTPRFSVEILEGLVERGPLDLIPNFMSHDAIRLYFITQAIKHKTSNR